jgi:hypothetical protein
MRQREQADKIGVFLRRYQDDARMVGKVSRENVVDVGVRMDRKDDGDILPAQDGLQRIDDVEDPAAEVLATMASHQDDPPVAVVLLDAVPPGRQAWICLDHGLG